MATVLFSIVIPTRNRPELFSEALDSALAQDCAAKEVIVVNDGSAPEYLDEYRKLESQYPETVRWLYQPQRPNGHGQSYSMNTGAYAAQGDFLCFLDDDDTWTDTAHLSRLQQALDADPERSPDVLYCHQQAVDHHGNPVDRQLWIADRIPLLARTQVLPGDNYRVSQEFLLGSRGFAHLNCTAIRRSLYLEIGGMDENIRYECDRDLYLRTLDASTDIRVLPNIIARHNVPDPARRNNMSTLVSQLEKHQYQLVVLEKSFLHAKCPAVQRSARLGLCTAYKHITALLAEEGRFSEAASSAWAACGLRFTLKWGLYTLYLSLRGALHGAA